MTASARTLYAVSRLPAWLTMAQQLEQQLDWQPTYWITRDENHDAVLEQFPGIVSHHINDLSRGIPTRKFESCLIGGLSKSDLERGAAFEPIAMDLLDRIDLGRMFSYQERQRFYHKLLIYWLNVIRKLSLDIAIFNSPPHSIGEYAAYAAFQMSSLQTRIFRPTPVNNLHIVCDNIDDLPPQLRRAYSQRLENRNLDILPAVREHLDTLRAIGADYKPWYSEKLYNREENQEKTRKILQSALEEGRIVPGSLELGKPVMARGKSKGAESSGISEENILKRRRKPDHEQQMRQIFKLPNRPLTALPWVKWEFVTYRDWALVQKLDIEQRYVELAVKPDLQCGYVYFSMHYQPERTTCPDGGRFNNQFLAIALLAETLPEGWMLYVKEHPSQFRFHSAGELCRWREYYEEIAAFPNVRLIPLDVSGIDLIDNAKAVATITGTSGWEGLVRGKPVLCFGAAWYGMCKGAYVIAEREDAANAFHDIAIGARPSQSDVDAYAGALQDIGQTVYINPSLEKAVKLDQDLATSLTNLMLGFESGK